MGVLINFKICDNVEECGGIEVCPTGALYWDKKKKTIAIDNSKCNSCGKCVEGCPVDAIYVAKNEKEHNKIKKEIDEDHRKRCDLFVDKYGAMPIHAGFLISQEKINDKFLKSKKFIAVEVFNDDSIMCLLRSIPIKVLFRDKDIDYAKTEAKDDSLTKEYNIKKLPCLLFFSNGKLIGKIEGYYENKDLPKIQKKVNKII